VRCPRCGNENPETNRFCGMCGATLLQETAPTEPAPSSATASSSVAAPGVATPGPAVASAPAPSTPRTQAAQPVISGPSFLGLNEPPPATRRRGSLSIDPHSAHSSRDLNYLLDDDEEPRGGAGKYILILLALGLAVGFGYLRWKNQGFAWLNPSAKKPAATAPNPEAPDGGSPAPSNAPADANPTPSSPSPSGSSQPAAPSTSPASTNSSSAGVTPAAGSPTSSAASAQPGAAPASGDTGAAGAAPAAATNPAATAAKDQDVSADSPTPANPTPANPAAATEQPKPAPAPATPRPRPMAKPAPPRDPVAEAQKYLYGKGASQDCDRGMRLLKPAADAANPKAMIEMGALYSAGLCTPRDLPTAYRWFALALRKDPDNQAVQTDLQKLWGEMTQPERQLAIRLSQ